MKREIEDLDFALRMAVAAILPLNTRSLLEETTLPHRTEMLGWLEKLMSEARRINLSPPPGRPMPPPLRTAKGAY